MSEMPIYYFIFMKKRLQYEKINSFPHQKIRDGANRYVFSILLERRLFCQCDNRQIIAGKT